MNPVVYEVLPMNKGWLVRTAGNSHSEFYAGKDEALHAARRLARECKQWRVRVLDEAGGVESEFQSTALEKTP